MKKFAKRMSAAVVVGVVLSTVGCGSGQSDDEVSDGGTSGFVVDHDVFQDQWDAMPMNERVNICKALGIPIMKDALVSALIVEVAAEGIPEAYVLALVKWMETEQCS